MDTTKQLSLSLSGSDSKKSACNAGDLGSIPGSGRSLGEGHGDPLQYSFLKNSTDKGAWRATVHGTAESDMTEQVTLSLSGDPSVPARTETH